MSHLITSLKNDNPAATISVLVFEEFAKSAHVLNHVANVFTIPRRKIISFHKNDIYSDAWAINQFNNSLEKVTSTKWNQIVNYSNDRTSSYISSYIGKLQRLSAQQISGVSFNERNMVNYSSQWSTIFNESESIKSNSPYNFNDFLHLSLGLANSEEEDRLKTNSKHNQTAFKNFNQIRKLNQNKTNDVQIVGVQLKSSLPSKDIPFEVLVQTIRYLHENNKTIPILLHAPTDEEKELTKRVNEEFDNKLITVESDIIALPSVLINIDLVVTPDTLIKHMADSTDTPSIEVSLGSAPFLLQGSVHPRSLIITESPNRRGYQKDKILSEDNNSDLQNNIESAIDYFLQSIEELNITGRWAAYRPIKDHIGTAYIPVAGDVDYQMEYTRFFSRIYTYKMINEGKVTDHPFNQSDNPEMSSWVSEQKNIITVVSKQLLNTIRSLHQMNHDTKSAHFFVDCLDGLLEYCQQDTLIRIPLLMFKAKLNSLTSETKEQNIKEVNTLLFELKNNIQFVNTELASTSENIASPNVSRMSHG